MDEVLADILDSGTVSDGAATLPLHSHMFPEACRLIASVFDSVKPDVSIEVGLAYGVSTLYACAALAKNQKPARHIVIDPYQRTDWRGIGIENIERAGYAEMVTLIEEKSEAILPRLLSQGQRVQAAIIDGDHRFDHAFVDFFYINKMLDVGGVIIFDDANWPSVRQLMDHIATYPAYKIFGTATDQRITVRTKIRRWLLKATSLPIFRRHWDDIPGCIAYQKIAPDERAWNWHVPF